MMVKLSYRSRASVLSDWCCFGWKGRGLLLRVSLVNGSPVPEKRYSWILASEAPSDAQVKIWRRNIELNNRNLGLGIDVFSPSRLPLLLYLRVATSRAIEKVVGTWSRWIPSWWGMWVMELLDPLLMGAWDVSQTVVSLLDLLAHICRSCYPS